MDFFLIADEPTRPYCVQTPPPLRSNGGGRISYRLRVLGIGRREARPSIGGWRRWRRGALASLGASPVFRAYIFLGSIAAILAFLLYNESIIAELREHEKNRVDLYAHLISFAPQASEGQIPTLFTEVITKVDFPRIITNHRGEIIQAEDIDTSSLLGDWAFWRSKAVDAPAASPAQLHRLIEEMDIQNPPIPFYWSPETLGRLYCEGERAVITDTQGAIAAWQGAGLPVSGDTSVVALAEVQRALQELKAEEPLSFSVPAAGFSYLHWTRPMRSSKTPRVNLGLGWGLGCR